MNYLLKDCIAKFSRLISDAEEKAKSSSEAQDLTSTQISYLETIQEIENPNITELAKALGLKKPSVTVVIDRLIQKGCVYKTHSDDDRRSSHLHLTDIGKQINQRHEFAHDYLVNLISKKLENHELAKLNELLNKIIN
ncbi:MAG: MarR family transcriptional regulator [Bacteroidales bacterium]|mgnify:FL=1|jgi:DNA-binding MarR family transcriptional regulator|nr:MarR family transcriptional regulator [Bacteroidales bacterium]MDD4655648.1 MarR family transcriptional regulator [Bacteroidales bacterium]MDD4828621.1 MarR family transcriptional regulator [Bacteroidales bacterium]